MTRASLDDIEDAIGQLELAKEAFKRADFTLELDYVEEASKYINGARSRTKKEQEYRRDFESQVLAFTSKAVRPYQRRKPRQHP